MDETMETVEPCAACRPLVEYTQRERDRALLLVKEAFIEGHQRGLADTVHVPGRWTRRTSEEYQRRVNNETEMQWAESAVARVLHGDRPGA